MKTYTSQRLNYEAWAKTAGVALTSIADSDWPAFLQTVAATKQTANVLAFAPELHDLPHTSEVVVSEPPEGVFLAVRHPSRRPGPEPVRRILVLTAWDEVFVDILQRVNRLPDGFYTVHRLPMTQWESFGTHLWNYDLGITFVVQDSAVHRLLKKQWLRLVGFGDLDMNRLFMVFPRFRREKEDPRTWFPIEESRMAYRVEEPWHVIYARPSVVALGKRVGRAETFLSRPLFASPEDHEDGWRCVGRPDLRNRRQCEATHGARLARGYWDKPCMTDTDCPFYRAERGRGGCSKGYCEFPIGVERLGFRRYSDEPPFQPFCRQCGISPPTPTCCATTNHPDYVFPGEKM